MRDVCWVQCACILVIVVGVVVSFHTQPTAPCEYPLPRTAKYDVFCQTSYHKSPYVCDPSGRLSRTEVEMLERTVRTLNFTSCNCRPDCESERFRFVIMVVDSVPAHSCRKCEFYTADSNPGIDFARILSHHWANACPLDLVLLYVGRFGDFPRRPPTIYSFYAERLMALNRRAVNVELSRKDTVLSALQRALNNAKQLIRKHNVIAQPLSISTHIPQWVFYLCGVLLLIVLIAVYIGNWVTKRLNKTRKPKWSMSSNRSVNSRFRAGFGGGMMMASTPRAKSTMMFRTFKNARTDRQAAIQRI